MTDWGNETGPEPPPELAEVLITVVLALFCAGFLAVTLWMLAS